MRLCVKRHGTLGGEYLLQHFTTLKTSEGEQVVIVSDEDTTEVWATAREETISRRRSEVLTSAVMKEIELEGRLL
jgi:hypothetical protein